MSSPQKPKQRGRKFLSILLSTVFACVAVGAVAVLAVGQQLLDSPTAAGPLDSKAQVIPAGPVRLSCPAPIRLLESDSDGNDAQFSPDSRTAETTVAASVRSDFGGVFPTSKLTELRGKQLRELSVNSDPDATEPRGSSDQGFTNVSAKTANDIKVTDSSVFNAEPITGQSAIAAAYTQFKADDGDLRGVAAQSCTPTANDQWFLGASTATGTNSVLNLKNSSDVPAQATVTVYSEAGEKAGSGTQDLNIPAGASRSIVLAGMAPNQDGLAVRVQSSGASLGANVQVSALRGLTPGGVDYISASAPASNSQSVTGVRLGNKDSREQVRSQNGYDSASSAVMLYSATDATVNLKVFGKDGEVDFPGDSTVTVAAGTVTSLPLDSLAEGTYSIGVESDAPVLATARMTAAEGEGKALDFGFARTSNPLGSNQIVPLPTGADVQLALSAAGESAQVDVVAVKGDGSLSESREVALSPGSTTTINPRDIDQDATSLLLSSRGTSAYASLVLTRGANQIAVIPIETVLSGSTQIPVQLGM